MTLPTYTDCMLPFLRSLQAGHEMPMRDVEAALAAHFALSAEDQLLMLPSGQSSVFKNRVGWARTYLKKAALIEAPRRGVFRITPRGLDVLASPPHRIDSNYLEQFAEFREFQALSKGSEISAANGEAAEITPETTPDERIEIAYQSLRGDLAQDLLARINECSPIFFEQLVVDLLVKMGYGGSRKDAGERVGQSNDGGIDGIIKEDPLGLDAIYIQAKRWQGTVGRPELQKFVGALQGQRARKGVFITTSSYTQGATDYAASIDVRVILIDGQQLAALMIDHDVGVQVKSKYFIKSVDPEYFETQ